MIFALATALFLATIWLAIQVFAASLDGKTGRIMAALRGEVPAHSIPVTVRVTQRYSGRPMRAERARPEWRAAA